MEALDSALGKPMRYMVVAPRVTIARSRRRHRRRFLHEPWWAALLRLASGMQKGQVGDNGNPQHHVPGPVGRLRARRSTSRRTDADIRRIAVEVVRSGGVRGLHLPNLPQNAFASFVVDRLTGPTASSASTCARRSRSARGEADRHLRRRRARLDVRAVPAQRRCRAAPDRLRSRREQEPRRRSGSSSSRSARTRRRRSRLQLANFYGAKAEAMGVRLARATTRRSCSRTATLAVDCFDNADSRIALSEAARAANVPLVHARARGRRHVRHRSLGRALHARPRGRRRPGDLRGRRAPADDRPRRRDARARRSRTSSCGPSGTTTSSRCRASSGPRELSRLVNGFPPHFPPRLRNRRKIVPTDGSGDRRRYEANGPDCRRVGGLGAGGTCRWRERIKTLTYEPAASSTRVIVRGTQTPTSPCTSSRSRRASSSTCQMRSCHLRSSVTTRQPSYQPNTWAVSAVGREPARRNGVRIVITLARPGRYDVKTDGNAVVINVTARDEAPTVDAAKEVEANARARAQSEAAKLDAMKQREAAAKTDADRKALAAERDAIMKAKADADAARLAAARISRPRPVRRRTPRRQSSTR